MPRSDADTLRDRHEEAVGALSRLVAGARRIVAFTGAGSSTESGVPDFRSPGSPWLKHPPLSFEDFMSGPQMRREAWRRKFVMADTWMGCSPGRGHRAIRRWDEEGRLVAVLTQNIDNLHLFSGFFVVLVVVLFG